MTGQVNTMESVDRSFDRIQFEMDKNKELQATQMQKTLDDLQMHSKD